MIKIDPFVIKEINSQLFTNQQLDNETIKQIYHIYEYDKIEEYKNKVQEKYKDYKFIKWIHPLIYG